MVIRSLEVLTQKEFIQRKIRQWKIRVAEDRIAQILQSGFFSERWMRRLAGPGGARAKVGFYLEAFMGEGVGG